MKNDVKKSSSFRFRNYEEKSLNSNSFGNHNINPDYFNILDNYQKFSHEFNDNNSKIISFLSETQLEKRLNKIKSVEKNAPILNIIVLSSNYYKTGKHFKIGPFGLINQNKNIDSNKEMTHCYKNNNKNEDKQTLKGVVYFGYYPDKINQISLENRNNINIKNNNNNLSKKSENKNRENISNFSNIENFDYIEIKVPPSEKDIENNLNYPISTKINTNHNNNLNMSILEKKKYGIYFYIYFNPYYMKYYIIDCGKSYGTFIKIQNEIILKNNYLINIGDTYMEISLGIESKSFLNEEKSISYRKEKIFSLSDSEYDNNYDNNLNLKIISKNKIYEPFNFLPTKSKIKIGRSSNCEISIDDILLSRVHCTIQYQNNIGWIIRDGYNNKENGDDSMDTKASTNGTWLYTFEDTPIYEGMILRSDNNLFRCKF